MRAGEFDTNFFFHLIYSKSLLHTGSLNLAYHAWTELGGEGRRSRGATQSCGLFPPPSIHVHT